MLKGFFTFRAMAAQTLGEPPFRQPRNRRHRLAPPIQLAAADCSFDAQENLGFRFRVSSFELNPKPGTRNSKLFKLAPPALDLSGAAEANGNLCAFDNDGNLAAIV